MGKTVPERVPHKSPAQPTRIWQGPAARQSGTKTISNHGQQLWQPRRGKIRMLSCGQPLGHQGASMASGGGGCVTQGTSTARKVQHVGYCTSTARRLQHLQLSGARQCCRPTKPAPVLRGSLHTQAQRKRRWPKTTTGAEWQHVH